MEEKKPTDEEVVNALEERKQWLLEEQRRTGNSPEFQCLYITGTAVLEILDLINRQKAEIERLTEEIKTTNGMTAEQVIESEKLKTSIAEAVNSFVRLETLYKVKCKELEIANKKLEELNGGKVD